MKSPKTVILALGSNLGNRIGYMQNALEKMHHNIGWVLEVSKIYETPAWGFEGNSFLNACVSVSTRLEASEVLTELLQIENELGRERSDSGNYQNRTIDLDILLFGEEIIETEILRIPHPGIPNRSFVLKPLNDIAASEKHPALGKKISQLLKETKDTSEITISSEEIKKPTLNYHFPGYNYIAVEGNIGAGKTSFSTMVSEDFNAKLILERFKDNPFLPKFYENKERYAFPLEMSFLADRYQQLSDDLAQYDLFKDFVISDYDVFKSLIFAKITLHEDEYSLYHKLFHLIYKELVKPELYIYLYQNTERLLENIKKRGRDYEQNIQPEYLMDINNSYLNFIKSQSNMKVQIIDISGLDFVSSRKDYLWLLSEIDKALV
ncbi:2-amino-4-hydroxy-6-hydroxymethyldihydropteridine diphosphokinase [Christiangramia forsetii]|uniref:2-amino-4-hydroxy-6-hydroxymethyldihydropteridine pyrophosphokinase n=2 Tax=Christiangramia forsetii TaxID=411153 RepID=A0LXY9_CHRFK|nr:2-amino-4-hydroxy-6-hydroxymethyldihydropteridine diphosphokinase [Christiangramia forsetii]GGG35445.1 2-amino-4-hydroxy-6-hydroxymethyldihydropteridine diphosphokinase [Christiangramia forsetii]CAL65234.1 protein containing HPPK and dNK domain [Christiangramia forsetii KT0803]